MVAPAVVVAVEMQVVESSSSSDELQCAGCSSCRGPLASDVEDADDEYDDAGDGIAAARDGMSRTITGAEARSRTRTTGRINRNTWSTCQKS